MNVAVLKALVAAGATPEMLVAAVEADQALEPKGPRTITPANRAAVLARDGHICRYCGSKDGPFHIDHVVARSKRGSSLPENLAVACRSCNASKKDRTLEEWKR